MPTLYQKYRPSTFADLIGQDHIKTTIGNQIAGGSVAHAYLFTGPRGVGKTTVARLIAKAVNCVDGQKAEGRKQKAGGGGSFEPCNVCDACKEIAGGAALDVFEIDAASHTDVENVRENIIKSVRFAPNRLKYKVYIIDEVHMLSTSSFNALLKTLEEPPAHALFILATTEIHKVPATIISRCQRFDFRRLKPEEMVARLKSIVQQEGVQVDEEVLAEVARHADGSERDAESMLGQILALGSGNAITLKEASLVLPATTHVMVEAFSRPFLNGDAAEAVRLVNQYAEEGVDLPHFVDDVIDDLRQRLLADLSAGKQAEVARGMAAIDKLLEARRYMKIDRLPQLSLELAIVALAVSQTKSSPAIRQDPASPERQEVGGSKRAGEERDFQKQEVDSRRLDPAHSVPDVILTPSEARGKDPSRDSSSSLDKLKTPQNDKTHESTASGLVSVSFDDVKRRWNEVFARIKDVNASLPLVLRAGVLAGVTGNVVEIRCAFTFHADTLNQERNRKALEEVLSALHNAPLRVHATHTPVEEAVSEIVKEFGGSVV